MSCGQSSVYSSTARGAARPRSCAGRRRTDRKEEKSPAAPALEPSAAPSPRRSRDGGDDHPHLGRAAISARGRRARGEARRPPTRRAARCAGCPGKIRGTGPAAAGCPPHPAECRSRNGSRIQKSRYSKAVANAVKSAFPGRGPGSKRDEWARWAPARRQLTGCPARSHRPKGQCTGEGPSPPESTGCHCSTLAFR